MTTPPRPLCPATHGTKACVMPAGHCGPWHTSASGSVWPDASLPPPPVSPLVERIRQDQRAPVDPSTPIVVMVSRDAPPPAPAPDLDAEAGLMLEALAAVTGPRLGIDPDRLISALGVACAIGAKVADRAVAAERARAEAAEQARERLARVAGAYHQAVRHWELEHATEAEDIEALRAMLDAERELAREMAGQGGGEG